VIDGPPTLGLADAPLLAAAAGEVLFVVESAKTRTRAAIEALNRLEATGTHVLGAVLTKGSEGDSYGYGYYGYGYGKIKTKDREILMLPNSEDGPEEAGRAAKSQA